MYGTDAEVINGSLDKQIVLYQSRSKNKGYICNATGTNAGMSCLAMKSSIE